MAAQPVLWHIPVSHYNEKARWALDYKGVPHERRAPFPGAHMAIALWLTRGDVKTFPVLEIDGRRIGDSTRIIAALEELYSDPPLYPEDPDERERALELEDFFDEEVAPHVRLLAWNESIKDREAFTEFASRQLPPAIQDRARPIVGPAVSGFLKLRYGAGDDDAARLAKTKIEAGLDRLEAELEGRKYLAGDAFSVADLSAATLFYPIYRPPEGPQVLGEFPEPLQRYCDSLDPRPGIQFGYEMFRRHRGNSAATRSSGLAAGRA